MIDDRAEGIRAQEASWQRHRPEHGGAGRGIVRGHSSVLLNELSSAPPRACLLIARVSFPRLPISLEPSETPLMPKGAEQELLDKWKIADAVETYGIRNWGKGYFAINKSGHVIVQPNKRPDESIDLKEL